MMSKVDSDMRSRGTDELPFTSSELGGRFVRTATATKAVTRTAGGEVCQCGIQIARFGGRYLGLSLAQTCVPWNAACASRPRRGNARGSAVAAGFQGGSAKPTETTDTAGVLSPKVPSLAPPVKRLRRTPNETAQSVGGQFPPLDLRQQDDSAPSSSTEASLLSLIFEVLQKLPPEQRRLAIAERFAQLERLMLCGWASTHRGSVVSPNERSGTSTAAHLEGAGDAARNIDVGRSQPQGSNGGATDRPAGCAIGVAAIGSLPAAGNSVFASSDAFGIHHPAGSPAGGALGLHTPAAAATSAMNSVELCSTQVILPRTASARLAASKAKWSGKLLDGRINRGTEARQIAAGVREVTQSSAARSARTLRQQALATIGLGFRAAARGRSASYQASVCFESLCLTAHETCDADRAAVALKVLSEIKRRVLVGIGVRGAVAHSANDFEAVVRVIISEVLLQHGIKAEQIGLKFHVQQSMRSWIYPPLHTPHTSSLDCVMQSWRQLAPFRSVSRKEQRNNCTRITPWDAEIRWKGFREAYLDVMASCGRCRDQTAARLDALERASRPMRERRLQRWHREAMALEDKIQHRGWRCIAAAKCRDAGKSQEHEASSKSNMRKERHAKRALELARVAEERQRRREQRAFAREDGRGRARRRAELVAARRATRSARRLLCELERLLKRWRHVRRRNERLVGLARAPTGQWQSVTPLMQCWHSGNYT